MIWATAGVAFDITAVDSVRLTTGLAACVVLARVRGHAIFRVDDEVALTVRAGEYLVTGFLLIRHHLLLVWQ